MKNNSRGIGNKTAIFAAAVTAAALLALSQQTSLTKGTGTETAAARVSGGLSQTLDAKPPAVSGGEIVSVNKPLYVIKEDEMMYTNIQWAIALEPEIQDCIPKDVTLVEPIADNRVAISGNNVTITLPPLAGVTPVVFTGSIQNIRPRDVTEDMIELVYGFRDGITLYGTITESGITKELAEDNLYYEPKNGGFYENNKWSGRTCYYLHGTIDRLKNDIKAGKGFQSGYRRELYIEPSVWVRNALHHESMYTYPGIVVQGRENFYEGYDLVGGRDVEYQAYSRFEIVYSPEDDLYQLSILLLDHGTLEAEGEDGHGNYEKDSGEGDIVYRINLLSDLKKILDVESYHEYMSGTYVMAD